MTLSQQGVSEMSANAELLQYYAAQCGLYDVKVDDKALLLTSTGSKEIGDLEEKKGVDYYINIEDSDQFRGRHFISNGFDIYDGANGVFVVDANNQRLLMFVPIY